MAKPQEKQQALATLESVDQIPQYLEIVNQKIKDLTKDVSDGPRTTKQLKGFGRIDGINTVSDLIRARASVVLKRDLYEKSARAMDISLTKYPCRIDGHAPSAWLEDIEVRVNTLKYKDELKKLKEVKAKLEANLSAKEKFKRDMADIANLLTSD